MRVVVLQRLAATIAALTLVLVLEMGVSKLYWNATTPDVFHLRVKRLKTVARDSERILDVLVVGDSTAAGGFIPAVFEQETGLTAYNFGTSAYVAAIADITLVEDYLAHHPTPQAVIVVRGVGMLADKVYDPYIQEHFERTDVAYFLLRHGEYSFERAARAIAASLIPSFRYKLHVQRVFRSSTWHDLLLSLVAAPSIVPDGTTHGYHRSDKVMGAEDVAQQVKKNSEHRPPHPQNLLLMGHLCGIATRRSVPVVFVSAPYLQDLDLIPSYHQAVADSQGTIKRVIEESGCRWVDAERFTGSAMADTIHTNETGATVFTQHLAEVVKSILHVGATPPTEIDP